MKTRKRIIISGILNHCYQKTLNGALLFYNYIDHLVHFTIVCIVAARYDVAVLSFCQMPDHIHGGYIASDKKSLSAFMRDSTMWYAKYGQAPQIRKREIFVKNFGSAIKKGDKKARTNIIYIGNNPVERHLVEKAEDYQWNYLAYAVSPNPFSKPLVIRKASCEMKKAIEVIKGMHREDQPLSYTLLKRLFSKLDSQERKQLIDFIVTTYSVIDYAAASRFFDSYEDMIGAMHYNTGSEYDINEVFIGRSDACYADIASWLRSRLNLKDIHDVFLLSEEKRTDLIFEIHKSIGASLEQIAKFLRLTITKVA